MDKDSKTGSVIPPAAKPAAAPAAIATARLKPPSEEAVRLCAYRKWETAGKPEGDAVRFWTEAEKELMLGK